MYAMLFKLVVMQPEVMLNHLTNYADLAAEELHNAFAAWRLRMLLYTVSVVLLGLGVACGLMSMLFWGALPLLHPNNAWVLVAAPVVLVVAGVCVGAVARLQMYKPFFENIQAQIDLDMLALGQEEGGMIPRATNNKETERQVLTPQQRLAVSRQLLCVTARKPLWASLLRLFIRRSLKKIETKKQSDLEASGRIPS